MRVLQVWPTPHAAFAHQRLQTRAYIHYNSPLNAINRYMHHGSTDHYMAVPLDKNRPAECGEEWAADAERITRMANHLLDYYRRRIGTASDL